MLKNLPVNAGDMSWISGLGRSPGDGSGNHSSILAWRIPWTEESGRLQSMGSQRVGHDLATRHELGAAALPWRNRQVRDA